MRNFINEVWTSKSRNFYIAALVILFFRFLIGATTEIVGDEYDTNGFAYLINEGYWGHLQDPVRPPFMPLMSWLVMQTGIPYRLFLELCFLASVFWVSDLVKREFGWATAIATLFLAAFNPYTIRSFTEAQREPLLLVLYIVIFGILLRIFRTLSRNEVPFVSAFALSVIFAFIILTREGEELFTSVMLFTSLALIFIFYRNTIKNKALIFLFLIFFPIFLLLQVTSAINQHYFGVGGYRGLLTYETKLLNQLNRIKTNDSLRYAPITNSTFLAAAENSPAFSEFGSAILKRDGFYELLREHSSSFVGAKEIDPTRTIWALNKALDDKYGNDSRLKSLKLQGATNELNSLLEANILPSHRFQLPYPFDPNIRHWIEHLPSAFYLLLKETAFVSGEFSGLGLRKDFNPINFDNAFNRRSALITKQFNGPLHKIREFFVFNYPVMLAMICVVVFFAPTNNVSVTGLAWAAIISLYLLSRTLVTSVLFTSVAPVNRYMVFSAPLFAIWMPIFIIFLKFGLASLKNRYVRSSKIVKI